MRIFAWIFVVLLIFNCSKEVEQPVRLTSFVNPFIGTDGPGNTYPGATVPFGMVQLSPDIGIPGWDRIAGYFYQDSIITGFSHTHLTGTGAGDLYDILVMPTNSSSSKRIAANNFKPFSSFSHEKESASPGYYSVDLLDYGIKAELTSTERVGIHQYTFPKDDSTKIHVDLGYSLNWDKPTDTHIEVVNDSIIQGYRFSTGWAKNQKLYFHMQFSKPFESYQLTDSATASGAINNKIELHFSTIENEKIVLKTGLSTANIQGASEAIKKETEDFNFETYRKRAEDTWEQQLKKVAITTDNEDQKRVFYTMMYQSMLAPTLLSDVNGYYKTANDAAGNYKADRDSISQAIGFNRYDTFSLWDTFRAAHPLYTLLHPSRTSDMVKSLLAHYDETGTLPLWSLQGNDSNMMIGYHAVPVIVDAYFKGIAFNANLAYEACKTSAMIDGREIGEYKTLGFVTAKNEGEDWSVSKTLEYAYDDWCMAMFAKDLGKTDDFEYFIKRSKNWQRLYNDTSSWIQPKDSTGRFLPNFVAKAYSPYFCESNAWHYYWYVPQNIDNLIAKTGGAERFEQKLDSMFSYTPSVDDKLPIFSTGMIGQYAHGNEPSHHVAYLYNYINKPSKAQKLVRQILNAQYKNQPNGHCGNEDCGQMSSWFVFSALGFYPVNPAQGIYSLGIPLFKEAELNLQDGKQFKIIAENFSEENIYVKRVTLNGKPLDRLFITHQEITNGGHIKFQMANQPSDSFAKDFSNPNTEKVYQ